MGTPEFAVPSLEAMQRPPKRTTYLASSRGISQGLWWVSQLLALSRWRPSSSMDCVKMP